MIARISAICAVRTTWGWSTRSAGTAFGLAGGEHIAHQVCAAAAANFLIFNTSLLILRCDKCHN
jgi:hypothetical protein